MPPFYQSLMNPVASARNERNEYHGITVERAKKVLDAPDVCLGYAGRGRADPQLDIVRCCRQDLPAPHQETERKP
jgi:hypothetical protein